MTETDRIIEELWMRNSRDDLALFVALYEAPDPEPPYTSSDRVLKAHRNRQALRDAIKEATRG